MISTAPGNRRLEVENFIIDLYLDRPDWIRHIHPGMSPEGTVEYIQSLRKQNERIKAAVEAIARKI